MKSQLKKLPTPHNHQEKELDQRVDQLHRSTAVLIPPLSPFHNWLRTKYPFYYQWHLLKQSRTIHWIVLFLYSLFLIISAFNIFFLPVEPAYAYTSHQITWTTKGDFENNQVLGPDFIKGTADDNTTGAATTRNQVQITGDNDSGDPNNNDDVTLSSGVWTTKASAPGSVGCGSALTYNSANGKIYAFVGGGSSAFWEYDPDSYFSLGTISNFKINAGDGVRANWSSISWNSTTPPGTAVKFRTRGADTEGDLSSATWSNYYTTSGSSITTPASSWLEIELTLESDGTNTPILSDFTIHYNTLDAPFNFTTYKNDGSTIISQNSWTNQSSIISKFYASGINSGDTLYPQLEVVSRDATYTSNPTITGGGVVYNGSPILLSVAQGGLAPGSYKYKVRFKDQLNRISAWSASEGYFGVDWTPPQTTESFDNQPWYTSNVVISLLPTDNLSGVKNSYFRVNDGPTNTGTEIIISEEGRNKIEYWSVDKAGNIESHKTKSEIKIDKNPPSAPSQLVIDILSEGKVLLSWQESGDAASGVREYRIYRSQDNIDFVEIKTTEQTSYLDTGLDLDDTYYYKVRAVDNVGHVSNFSKTALATLSTEESVVPPTVPSITKVEVADNKLKIYGQAQPNPNIELIIQVFSDPIYTFYTFADSEGNFEYVVNLKENPLEPGKHLLKIKVRDPQTGVESDYSFYEFEIPVQPAQPKTPLLSFLEAVESIPVIGPVLRKTVQTAIVAVSKIHQWVTTEGAKVYPYTPAPVVALVIPWHYLYLMFVTFMSWFGMYGKRKTWGIVFDDATKMPLPKAFVSLFRDGKRVAICLSDKEGEYGFITEEPGNYQIEVFYPGYEFPCAHKRKIDILYDNLYYGEVFRRDQDSTFSYNIPLDPRTYYPHPKLYIYWKALRRFMSKISFLFLIFGIVWGLDLIFTSPSFTNGAILLLYGSLLSLDFSVRFGSPKKKLLSIDVMDQNQNLLSNILLQVFDKDNKVVISKTTDEQGRVVFMLKPGKYTFKFFENIPHPEVLGEEQLRKLEIFEYPPKSLEIKKDTVKNYEKLIFRLERKS